MNKEITADDKEKCSSIEIPTPNEQNAHVMPLLYIQQGKLHSGHSPTSTQALVPSAPTQLTAIINPVNSSIIAGQNKVFIQSPNQVSSNKQHIVIRHPITTVDSTPKGKLHSGHLPTSTQTLVSSSPTQLTDIIKPSNNSTVAGQNKVYIEGSNQTNQPPNKQHIVIRHPITTVNLTPTPPGPKHILVRKPNSTNAQILSVNTTMQESQNKTEAKHGFSFVRTLMKPTNQRKSLVIPGATIPPNQIQKPKLMIAPIPISQLIVPATTIPGSETQSQKMLIETSPIHEQLGLIRQPSMLSTKLSNGQVDTDSKGTAPVLRESKSTNSTPNPPPLHPISKISLLNINKNKSGNNSTDSIKITENPDSAVITPIPKKDDSNQPEKRRKTISNILSRGSSEKRPKKQNLSKNRESMMDLNYSIDSPESDDKSKKSQNSTDDDITLIKVVPNENKAKVTASTKDEIKIEVIKTPTSSANEVEKKSGVNTNNSVKQEEGKELTNGNHNSDPNFDATKALDWKDGVGSLPGSSLKFCINEFGLMEVVDDDENNKQDKHNSIGDKENMCLSQNSSKSSSVTGSTEKKDEAEKKVRPVSADTLYRCDSCGCYGLAAEFESPVSCSPACTEIIEANKQHALRREKEASYLRAKRKRKRLQIQEQQAKQQEQEEQEKQLKLEKQEKQEKQEKTEKQEKVLDVPKSESEEDSKDIIITNDDEESLGASSEAKYPWQRGKHGFSWSKYLEYCKAKAAPVKLFKDAFPYGKNLFKVGMKLEGIDPEHPSHYCVLTVFEVSGYRIRLHFDGYPENFDFWLNADSLDIFPVGWSEKNSHQLDPPKGYVASNFNWNAYLKTCKATPAPKTAFFSKSTVFPPTGFRVGMKLEAVDRKHSTSVCVASIAGLMDSRILVHFDSWDEVYDYWADPSSPYIHPVGWCHHNGHSLIPPNSYKDPKSFTWDAYLRETRSVAAPARAFKQRPPCGFKRGMKLEAVDKRVPQLIRVASVEDIKDHRIKIRFDGWPENHAYWVDNDSPDIHPMGWCNKTGYQLEPPLTPEVASERSECGTPGCRGIGHIKGPRFATHNSASGCPYSPQNLHKIRIASDRLNVKHEMCDYDEDSLDKTKNEKKMDRSERLAARDEKIIKIETDIKQEDADLSDKYQRSETSERSGKSRHHNSDGQSDDDEHTTRKRRKRRQVSEERSFSLSNSGFSDGLTSVHYAPNMPDKQLRNELYQSVYNPGYNPLPDAPHIWAKHSNALNRVVAKQNTNPRRWSNEEVIKFIQGVPNCKEVGSIFRKHSIDGEAFLMLTQEDLVSLLGLRLGPAIKLYNSIVLLRKRAT